MADLPGRKVFKVFSQDFIVDDRFTVTKELGQGAYGIVCAAVNNYTNEGVAIKKVTNVFSKKILAKRALREIKLLQHFRNHRNITCLYDMDIPRPENFNETYLYEELMECDLAAIIRSGQPLTDAHFQSFIYQILCGLKFIHSANVLHRDLKPGNLLVNADCELKICDFGLARGFSIDTEQNAGYMTEYVATRWYRAPEIMLNFQNYTKAIDVWSVGCILAELLGGRPFFKGRDYVDQINQILNVLGKPSEATIKKIQSPQARQYVRGLNIQESEEPDPDDPNYAERQRRYAVKLFHPLFRRTSRGEPAEVPELELIDPTKHTDLWLLGQMLSFIPNNRIKVEEALRHPYLEIWHDEKDEPTHPTPFDFTFEVTEDVAEMRTMIVREVFNFRQQVRQAPVGVDPGVYGAQGQHAQVPIPTGRDAYQWKAEDPRPQDLQYANQAGGLEAELGGR